MKIANHETDLYLLPESIEEKKSIIDFLKANAICHQFSMSNVSGQDWFGKVFIEIPFGIDFLNRIKTTLLSQRN